MDNQNQVDAQQHSSQSPSSQPEKPPKEKKILPSLPEGWRQPDDNSSRGLVELSAFVEQRSHLLLPLLGYTLLLFTLLDYVHIVIPLRFTDFLWEFRTIGALVEHVVTPLLGLILVFYRHQGCIGKWERNILGLLSWVSLLVGLLYLLMLPLGVADTWRIYYANNAQINYQSSQQLQQFQQVKGQLNQAKTDEQIKQLVVSLTPQVAKEEIKNPQAIKEQYLAKIFQSEKSIQNQADSVRNNQAQALIKDSVRSNLGALLSGTVFIWIWHLTDWARTREY